MMSSCWQISFHPKGQISEEFENFLEEYFEVYAQNFDDDGKDEYIGYTAKDFKEEDMQESAKKHGLTLPPYKVEKLESANWLKDYVIRFAPFEVADFCIYGIHEKEAPKTNKIPLQIYAATAFGSDHQTTRACLTAISELYHNGFVAKKILDVGTGSGILSLAAASLWPKAEIVSVDIDDESVLVTQSNAQNNKLESKLKICQSDGYKAPLVKENAPYDLVLANILARPLLEMAPDLQKHLSAKGYAILSGFVDNQTDWIISTHQQYELKLCKLYEFDNWRAALLQKA